MPIDPSRYGFSSTPPFLPLPVRGLIALWRGRLALQSRNPGIAETAVNGALSAFEAASETDSGPPRNLPLTAALTALRAIAQRQSGRNHEKAYNSFSLAEAAFRQVERDGAMPMAPFLSDYLAMLADFGNIDNSFAVAQQFHRAPRDTEASGIEDGVFLWLLAAALIPTPRSVLALASLLQSRGMEECAFDAFQHAAAFAIATGDAAAAAEAAEGALSIHADNGDARSFRGFIRLRSGDPQSAYEDFSIAAESNADNIELHLALAEASIEAGKMDGAARELEVVLEKAPGNLGALYLRGGLHRRAGDAEKEKGDAERAAKLWQLAIADLTNVIDGGNRSSAIYQSRGAAYFRLGKLEHALEDYDDAIRLDPSDAESHGRRAEILLSLNHKSEALAAVNVALALLSTGVASDSMRAYLLRLKGDVYIREEWFDPAIKVLVEAVALERTNPASASLLLHAYRSMSKWEELAREARRLQAYEYNSEFLRSLRIEEVEAYSNNDDYEAALAALTRQPGPAAEHPDMIWWHARLLCDVGDFESALEVLRQNQSGNAKSIRFLGLQGWILQNLEPCDAGQRFAFADEGRRTYKQAMELATAPDRSEARNVWLKKGLANATLRAGDAGAARTLYEEVIAACEKWDLSSRENARVLALLGWCHYQQRNCELAARFFESAIEKGDRALSVAFDRALVISASSRGEAEGLQRYKDALSRAGETRPLRWIGVCRVALHDLKESLFVPMGLTAAPAIANLLSIHLLEAVSRIAASYPALAAHIFDFLDAVATPPLSMPHAELDALRHRIQAARLIQQQDGYAAIAELKRAAEEYSRLGDREWEATTWAEVVRLCRKLDVLEGVSQAARKALEAGLYQFDRAAGADLIRLETGRAAEDASSHEQYAAEICSAFADGGAERAFRDANDIVEGMSKEERDLFRRTLLRVFKVKASGDQSVLADPEGREVIIPSSDAVVGGFVHYPEWNPDEDPREEVSRSLGVPMR